MKKEKLDTIKKALLSVGKMPDDLAFGKMPDDLNDKVHNFDDSIFMRSYASIWNQFQPVYPQRPEPEPPKKEPRWFVVHEGEYDTYVSEHHTKKEALEEMKNSLWYCYLIKGKIVKIKVNVP